MSNTPKVLVTGANGLLATNVIAELLTEGYRVRGLIRNPSNFRYGQHPHLELLQGDITNQQDIETAVQGCDYVVHVAALTVQHLRHYADYQGVNVAATRNLIEAAVRSNATKFVYVSTANTFGYGTKEAPGCEDLPIARPFDKSLYALSKLEGQSEALSYQSKINVVVVNPTFMLGPYDSKPSSGRIVLLGQRKRILFYPPGGKNFIHVQDAARGVVKALEKGKNGEAYLLANENLSYKEFFQKMASRTGNHPLLIMAPRPLLLAAGAVGSILRILGVKTEVSLTNMRILCINNYYSNEKAVKAFGLSVQPIEKAIVDCLEWFSTNR
jgi:dihydroflavonol-4-reductase